MQGVQLSKITNMSMPQYDIQGREADKVCAHQEQGH